LEVTPFLVAMEIAGERALDIFGAGVMTSMRLL
jgi:hypothetical protein